MKNKNINTTSKQVASLAEDDILILYYIQKYRFLSVEQTYKVIGTKMSKPSISRKLKKLQDIGLLNNFGNCRVGFTRIPKIYYITENGYNLLLDEAFEEENLGPYRKKSKPTWSPVFKHRMMLIDVCISLELSIRARPNLQLTKVMLDYNIDAHGHRETMDYVGAERENIYKLIPDAAVVIKNITTKTSILYLIELDRGTEAIRAAIKGGEDLHSIHYRMEKYDHYLLSGNFNRKYQEYGKFNAFMLLFITSIPGRVENIRKRMMDLPVELAEFYLFNCFDTVEQDFFCKDWKNRDIKDEAHYQLPGT